MVDRRKAPEAPTLHLEQGYESPSWTIMVNDDSIYLNLREEEASEARYALARFVAGRKLQLDRGASYRSIFLYDALTWARDVTHHRVATGQTTKRVAGSHLTRIQRLIPYWSRFTAGDVTLTSIEDFVIRRRGKLDPFTTSGPCSKATVNMEINILGQAVDGYCRSLGLNGKLDIYRVSPPSGKDLPIISRSDLARLLLTTIGYQWDDNRKRMVMNPNKHARLKTRQTRLHVARTILIAAYTASDFHTVLNLRWSAADDDEVSFVELGDKRSLLHRLGKDSSPGKQKGVPIALNYRIVAHLRRWQRQDVDRGATHIIMFSNPPKPLQDKPYPTFRKMLIDLGLDSSIKMECIRHSACVYLAHQHDVNTRSSAFVAGMSMSKFEERYGHHRPEYQKEAFDALMSKPSSIR